MHNDRTAPARYCAEQPFARNEKLLLSRKYEKTISQIVVAMDMILDHDSKMCKEKRIVFQSSENHSIDMLNEQKYFLSY